MSTTLSTAMRNAGLTAQFVTLPGAAATVELWNGTKPASLGAPAGTKLGTLNCGNPAVDHRFVHADELVACQWHAHFRAVQGQLRSSPG
jgi:hypothetical protein